MAQGVMIDVDVGVRWFVRPGIWLGAAMLHGGALMINPIARRGFKIRVNSGRWMIGEIPANRLRVIINQAGIKND